LPFKQELDGEYVLARMNSEGKIVLMLDLEQR
jgi:hypothetical protein